MLAVAGPWESMVWLRKSWGSTILEGCMARAASQTTGRVPNDVRPIALTDSLGKIVPGLLTRHLTKLIQPTLCTLPLFAYLPNRGTLEALNFVCAHCRHVRSLCEANSQSYWKRQASHAPPGTAGGFVFSLDMSQAFDRLPGAHLASGLQMLEVDARLSQIFSF